jgi:hypothetical protein
MDVPKGVSVRIGQKADPKFINRLLAVNFEVMDNTWAIKPFSQDIVDLSKA